MLLETGIMIKSSAVEGSVLLSDNQIKEIQKVNYQTAKDIISFCKQYNLKIYLGGGTALGAVRHRGFIPWDDDMDLNMPRKDFEFFIDHFLDFYGDRYYYKNSFPIEDFRKASMLKIVKKGTVYRRPSDVPGEDTGLWVDIWIIENTYDNIILRNVHGAGCYLLTALLSCKSCNVKWRMISKFYKNNQRLLNILKLKRLLGYTLFFISLRTLNLLQGAWFRLCKNDQSKYVTVPQGRKKFFGELRLRYPFLNQIEIDFEETKFPITEVYDEYLTSLYGVDYMQEPPLEKREKHAALEIKY